MSRSSDSHCPTQGAGEDRSDSDELPKGKRHAFQALRTPKPNCLELPPCAQPESDSDKGADFARGEGPQRDDADEPLSKEAFNSAEYLTEQKTPPLCPLNYKSMSAQSEEAAENIARRSQATTRGPVQQDTELGKSVCPMDLFSTPVHTSARAQSTSANEIPQDRESSRSISSSICPTESQQEQLSRNRSNSAESTSPASSALSTPSLHTQEATGIDKLNHLQLTPLATPALSSSDAAEGAKSIATPVSVIPFGMQGIDVAALSLPAQFFAAAAAAAAAQGLPVHMQVQIPMNIALPKLPGQGGGESSPTTLNLSVQVLPRPQPTPAHSSPVHVSEQALKWQPHQIPPLDGAVVAAATAVDPKPTNVSSSDSPERSHAHPLPQQASIQNQPLRSDQACPVDPSRLATIAEAENPKLTARDQSPKGATLIPMLYDPLTNTLYPAGPAAAAAVASITSATSNADAPVLSVGGVSPSISAMSGSQPSQRNSFSLQPKVAVTPPDTTTPVRTQAPPSGDVYDTAGAKLHHDALSPAELDSVHHYHVHPEAASQQFGPSLDQASWEAGSMTCPLCQGQTNSYETHLLVASDHLSSRSLHERQRRQSDGYDSATLQGASVSNTTGHTRPRGAGSLVVLRKPLQKALDIEAAHASTTAGGALSGSHSKGNGSASATDLKSLVSNLFSSTPTPAEVAEDSTIVLRNPVVSTPAIDQHGNPDATAPPAHVLPYHPSKYQREWKPAPLEPIPVKSLPKPEVIDMSRLPPGARLNPPQELWSSNPELNVFTMDEIQRHNTEDSCWLVVKGVVYDVTDFIPYHPGGARAIVKFGGTDAEVHYGFHSGTARKLWSKFEIGRLYGYEGESKCTVV